MVFNFHKKTVNELRISSINIPLSLHIVYTQIQHILNARYTLYLRRGVAVP